MLCEDQYLREALVRILFVDEMLRVFHAATLAVSGTRILRIQFHMSADKLSAEGKALYNQEGGIKVAGFSMLQNIWICALGIGFVYHHPNHAILLQHEWGLWVVYSDQLVSRRNRSRAPSSRGLSKAVMQRISQRLLD